MTMDLNDFLTGSRPDHDTYFLLHATVAATRGSCVRRKGGCVVVDVNNHILATGYNGPPTGVSNCTKDQPCGGAHHASGDGLIDCNAVHAEMNALLQCPNVMDINTLYTTTEPCPLCTRLIMNTGCRRVIYIEPYAKSGKYLWEKRSGSYLWVRRTPLQTSV